MFSKLDLSSFVSVTWPAFQRTLCVCLAFIVASSTATAQRLQNGPLKPEQNSGSTQGAKPLYGPAKPSLPQPQNQQAIPRQPIKQAQAPRPMGPPKEFILTPAQQDVVDRMLTFWEQKTSGIKTLECKFARWVYDPNFGPQGNAKSFTTGEIRYAAVDQGMIRETAVYKFDAKKKQAGEKWPFTIQPNAVGEHWVCDGKSVFEFSHKNKELVEIKLPEAMQGNAIADGPLPFMFGAKADKIKSRYWIRELPRPNEEAPYHLEMLPKRMGEDFSRIRIKLDAKDFLPAEMVLYELNQVGRSAYAFRDIKANAAMNNLQNFMGGFVKPKTPRGWKKIVRDVGPAQPAPSSQQPIRQAAAPKQNR